MLFKIDPQSFNAVMACAAKDDVWYYLNTFYIDVDNRRLVATNGHILAFAPLEKIESGQDAEPDDHRPRYSDKMKRGFLFNALGRPIANSGDSVTIDCGTLELAYQSGRKEKIIRLEKCDGLFPEYDRVKYVGDTKAVDRICFQPEYVAKMLRWADVHPGAAMFSFNGQLNVIGVRLRQAKLADVHVSLMPCRG